MSDEHFLDVSSSHRSFFSEGKRPTRTGFSITIEIDARLLEGINKTKFQAKLQDSLSALAVGFLQEAGKYEATPDPTSN